MPSLVSGGCKVANERDAQVVCDRQRGAYMMKPASKMTRATPTAMATPIAIRTP